ncbi:hypothetical protein cyc_02354 [Cyclospora cayetanensis]|uniref:Uncharacterized protein n=1 Tax=Cyclospora cayetanensis TaxID=88456 RepID=A0A1D3D0Z3_9EIME|nr:hypothetical protein cyc_02354 [Cyclospora cayetanensis]
MCVAHTRFCSFSPVPLHVVPVWGDAVESSVCSPFASAAHISSGTPVNNAALNRATLQLPAPHAAAAAANRTGAAPTQQQQKEKRGGRTQELPAPTSAAAAAPTGNSQLSLDPLSLLSSVILAPLPGQDESQVDRTNGSSSAGRGSRSSLLSLLPLASREESASLEAHEDQLDSVLAQKGGEALPRMPLKKQAATAASSLWRRNAWAVQSDRSEITTVIAVNNWKDTNTRPTRKQRSVQALEGTHLGAADHAFQVRYGSSSTKEIISRKIDCLKNNQEEVYAAACERQRRVILIEKPFTESPK